MQVMCVLVIHHDRVQGQRSSGLMLLFWLGLVIYGSFKLRTYILIARDQVQIDSYSSTYMYMHAYVVGLFVVDFLPPILRSMQSQSSLPCKTPMNNHVTGCYGDPSACTRCRNVYQTFSISSKS